MEIQLRQIQLLQIVNGVSRRPFEKAGNWEAHS